jgi:hypothetical protein
MGMTKFEDWKNRDVSFQENMAGDLAAGSKSFFTGLVGKTTDRLASLFGKKITDLNNPTQRKKLIDAFGSMIVAQIESLPPEQIDDKSVQLLVNEFGTRLKQVLKDKVKKMG